MTQASAVVRKLRWLLAQSYPEPITKADVLERAVDLAANYIEVLERELEATRAVFHTATGIDMNALVAQHMPRDGQHG